MLTRQIFQLSFAKRTIRLLIQEVLKGGDISQFAIEIILIQIHKFKVFGQRVTNDNSIIQDFSQLSKKINVIKAYNWCYLGETWCVNKVALLDASDMLFKV